MAGVSRKALLQVLDVLDKDKWLTSKEIFGLSGVSSQERTRTILRHALMNNKVCRRTSKGDSSEHPPHKLAMTSRSLWKLALVLFMALPLHAQTWSVEEFAAPVSSGSMIFSDVNNNGTVVGYTTVEGVLYDGTIQYVLPPSSLPVELNGITDDGIVIAFEPSGVVPGQVWDSVADVWSPSPVSPVAWSQKRKGIYEVGLIASPIGWVSYITDGTTVTNLVYPGGFDTWIYGVNSSGFAVGAASFLTGTQAVSYDWTTQLWTSYPDVDVFHGVNDYDQFVGVNYFPTRPIYWDSAVGVVDLPLPAGSGGLALGINNSGVIVGGYISPSVAFIATPNSLFERGDVNQDGAYDLSDALFTSSALFTPGSPWPACEDQADVNDDGLVDVSDIVYTLNSLFLPGSPVPIDPWGFCGVDMTVDTLSCISSVCP